MESFDSAGFVRRIQQRLGDLNLTPRAASLRAGANSDLMRGMLRGANKSVRGDHLVGLARALKVSESWLITGEDIPGVPDDISTGVAFAGTVEAGAFRLEDGTDQDAARSLIPIPPDPRFPRQFQGAFKVVGDSMTRAHIHDGMYVLAVDLEHWERRMGELADGALVVVQRMRNGHPERELTVKRLRMFRDRLELRPESDNPEHKPLVFPLPMREADAEARILAVCLQATWILA